MKVIMKQLFTSYKNHPNCFSWHGFRRQKNHYCVSMTHFVVNRTQYKQFEIVSINSTPCEATPQRFIEIQACWRLTGTIQVRY